MAKAEYSSKNIGHYGLSLNDYVHFTSPIRRYADLIIHRIIDSILNNNTNSKSFEGICKHISKKEREASMAERESIKLMQIKYMEKHVGDTFEGVISGVIDHGFFVELVQNGCEGFVRASSLKGFYQIDNKKIALVNNDNKFTLGQSVDVKVIAIDTDNTTREINVTLDKGAVSSDKSLKRDLKPFVERSTTLKSEVVVDDKGQVILGASSNNVNDSNRSANLNGTNLLNSQNETFNNDQQTDSSNIDLNATLKLASVAREGNIVKVKINDDNSNNVAQYSLKVSKTDSSPRAAQNPDWLQIDPQTGEIQAQPPENVEGISLQILAEDEDGVVRTLEIDVDFTSEELSLNMDQPEIEGNIVEFASLQDQINLEFEGYENYGDKFTKVSG